MGTALRYKTPEALETAIVAYFDAISHTETATVMVPTGELDSKGREIKERRELPGKVVTHWLKPPSVAGLCLHLGINRDTWCKYAKRPGYEDTCERARMRLEDYWVAGLERNSSRGAEFALANNYGWSGRWQAKPDDGGTGGGQTVEEYLRKQEAKDGGNYEY